MIFKTVVCLTNLPDKVVAMFGSHDHNCRKLITCLKPAFRSCDSGTPRSQMQGNRGGRPDQHNHGPTRQPPNLQHDRRPPGTDSNGQHADGGEQPSPSKNLPVLKPVSGVAFSFFKKNLEVSVASQMPV